MFDFEDDLKLAFLDEAQSLLDETEAAFISLDEGDRSPELIDKIFRLAHNFKGSAKTVGLVHLSNFGHLFEEVLTQLKKGALTPEKAVCTVLLTTLDNFKAYVAGLKVDLTYVHDVSEISLKLNALKDGTSAVAAMAVAPPEIEVGESRAEVEPAELAKAKEVANFQAEPLIETRVKAVEEETLKVGRKKLDTLLNLIGELVVNQSMVAGFRDQNDLQNPMAIQTLNVMEKIVLDIQGISTALRMTPISPLFQKLKRIARDAGQNLEKTIQFVTEGEHVEVDKIVLEKISDPLTHLVRNAVDHGIETDSERMACGKSAKSIVTLSSVQKEDRIVITLSDNGRGMNPQKLIAKAVEKGLIPANEKLSDEQAYSLIFKPGFSTKEQVTDMSGRGVGMDVVQTAISALHGHISIATKFGEGTQFTISLPLSMSIIAGMLVGIDQKKYVVPISQLVETVELNHFRIESSTGRGQMFKLREDVIPLYSLPRLLHPSIFAANEFGAVRESSHRPALITALNGKKFAFEIDQIFGQQQIVLKKLGYEIQELPGIVAGAILNTGEPGFVLNLADFLHEGSASEAA